MRPLFLVIALLLAGCAAAPPKPAEENRVGVGFSPPPPGSLIVLLPTPEVEDSKPLALGLAQLQAQVRSQLQAAGYRVELLGAQDHGVIWKRHVDEAGGLFDPGTGARRPGAYGRALSALAQTLCMASPCQLVLQPTLARRLARMEGTAAEWDGVQQRIRIKEAGGSEYRMRGSTPAISVEVLGLTARGSLAFRGFAGVTLVYDPNVREARSELRHDLFSDEADMAEAVRIVLQPLVPRPRRD